MSRILVLGAGIAGCSAALELARHGHRVTVAERGSAIGGKIVSYCCKATDECSRCGVCVAHTAISEMLAHSGVTVLTGSDVRSVVRTGRRFAVSLKQDRPVIRHGKCDNCGLCVDACPEECITRYDRGGLVYHAIDHTRCRLSNGRQCRKCAATCPASAIVASIRSEKTTVAADAVVIATGHAVFDAKRKPEMGYGRVDGVITGDELEQMLSSATALKAKDVAFVQCVGSRDPEIGRNYCSAACCAYTMRMARMLKYASPESRATVYCIDVQNFDKAFSRFRSDVVREGVEYVRTVPSSISSGADGRPVMRLEGNDGKMREAAHDLAVLSVGLGPQPDAGAVGNLFGLKRDESGFFVSAPDGVYLTGTCAEPQGITDAMASAKATAAQVMAALPAAGDARRPTQKRIKSGSGKRIEQSALVIGGGVAGITVARGIADRGFDVVLVEKSADVGGRLVGTDGNIAGVDQTAAGVDVEIGTEVKAVKGSVGSFAVSLSNGTSVQERTFGALIVCVGADEVMAMANTDGVMSMADMCRSVENADRKDRPRVVGIVLDCLVEETKAGSKAAMDCAIRLRKKYRLEVYIFCREVRVNARNLELLYDEARDAGVNIVKYSGPVRFVSDGDQVDVVAQEPLLRESISVKCDIVGVSDAGMGAKPDSALVGALGLTTDVQGQVQDNNVHFFPEMTNRPGIFVVGACRGQHYLADVLRDARVTALSVGDFLGSGRLPIESGSPVVDATKCALCLTCVRSCPHGAMVVDKEKRTAACVVEACRRCGICVGECPAGAIELQ